MSCGFIEDNFHTTAAWAVLTHIYFTYITIHYLVILAGGLADWSSHYFIDPQHRLSWPRLSNWNANLILNLGNTETKIGFHGKQLDSNNIQLFSTNVICCNSPTKLQNNWICNFFWLIGQVCIKRYYLFKWQK